MSSCGFWMALQTIPSSKIMMFTSGMSGKQRLETWVQSMDFSGEIGLITTMDNTLIRSIKSLNKSETTLHQEESLSALGMLPIYRMKVFPLKKMSKKERWHWPHAMHFFNFLFRKENFHVSCIREVAIHF